MKQRPGRLPGQRLGPQLPDELTEALGRYLREAPAREPSLTDDLGPGVDTRAWHAALLEDTLRRPISGGTVFVPKVALPATYPANLRFLRPGDRPANLMAHRVLYAHVFGPGRSTLLSTILAEPFYREARRAWCNVPADVPWHAAEAERANNLAIVHSLFDRLSASMSACFGFRPAPMVYEPEMYLQSSGTYYPDRHVITLSIELLLYPIDEAVDTIVHEQTHALQECIHRAYDRGSLDNPCLQSLASFWRWDERHRRPNSYNTHLGIEEMARYMGEATGAAIRRL